MEFLFWYFISCVALSFVFICSRLLSDRSILGALDWEDCCTLIGVAFVPVFNVFGLLVVIQAWYERAVK